MAGKVSFQRWRGFAADAPADLEDAKVSARFQRELARKVDEYCRNNNAVFEDSTDIASRFRGIFPLDSGVGVGNLVYFNGDRMTLASVGAVSKRPMAVVDSLIAGGDNLAYCWYGSGEVSVVTDGADIPAGRYVYLSSSDGVCTMSPPTVDGSSVMHQSEVGLTVGRAANGLVPVVFAPRVVQAM